MFFFYCFEIYDSSKEYRISGLECNVIMYILFIVVGITIIASTSFRLFAVSLLYKFRKIISHPSRTWFSSVVRSKDKLERLRF